MCQVLSTRYQLLYRYILKFSQLNSFWILQSDHCAPNTMMLCTTQVFTKGLIHKNYSNLKSELMRNDVFSSRSQPWNWVFHVCGNLNQESETWPCCCANPQKIYSKKNEQFLYSSACVNQDVLLMHTWIAQDRSCGVFQNTREIWYGFPKRLVNFTKISLNKLTAATDTAVSRLCISTATNMNSLQCCLLRTDVWCCVSCFLHWKIQGQLLEPFCKSKSWPPQL